MQSELWCVFVLGILGSGGRPVLAADPFAGGDTRRTIAGPVGSKVWCHSPFGRQPSF